MTEKKLDRSWADICKRYLDEGRDVLSDSELEWCNLAWFRFQVGDGGFQQYFSSPWDYPNQNKDTISALQDIGAGFVADELINISALYGTEVPFEAEARNDIAATFARGGPEQEVIDQAGKTMSSSLTTLDKKIDRFLLDNEFCDVWDLK